MSETPSIPYPSITFRNETEVIDWALSVLGFQLTDQHTNLPTDAFTVFENLVRLKLGQTLGEAIKSDLEDMNNRIKHLETATATREWNPLGQTKKIRP